MTAETTPRHCQCWLLDNAGLFFVMLIAACSSCNAVAETQAFFSYCAFIIRECGWFNRIVLLQWPGKKVLCVQLFRCVLVRLCEGQEHCSQVNWCNVMLITDATLSFDLTRRTSVSHLATCKSCTQSKLWFSCFEDNVFIQILIMVLRHTGSNVQVPTQNSMFLFSYISIYSTSSAGSW